MDKKILRIALENAVKYKGKANVKGVFGKVLSEIPELKKKIKTAQKEIKEIVDYVNGLSLDEQKKKFSKFKVKKKVVKKVREIPDLKTKGKVVMRFAPNPNGPISLGHCRIGLWNWFFVQKYKGTYILRLDDTDPKNKVPMKEAYKWAEEDLKWLGVKPKKVVRQSSRFETYYDYAEKLIKRNGAYICTCSAEDWRELTKKKTPCPCRELSSKDNLLRWKKMFKGYKEGQAVYRVKTDIKNKDPALRDWPGFRIVDKPKHPFGKGKVWPLLNFASAIDDHDFGVTHILRGVDLRVSDDRQKYLYNYFKWKYPETIYAGKFLVSGVKSTSESVKLIANGKLSGWDDPRLGTIKALRRRGFSPEVISRFIKEAGIGKNDLNVSIEKLAAFSKDCIDDKTYRYFFIPSPKKIRVVGAPKQKIELDLHPHKKKGGRKFSTSTDFYISERLSDGSYRLMDCLNFIKKGNKYSFESKERKKGKMLHWLPVSKDLVNVELLNSDGRIVKGLGEKGLKSLKIGDVVQFVRVGFVKLENKSKDNLQFIFSHQ